MMKLFRNIAGRVFAVYALLLFVITLLIVLIPIWIFSFLPDPAKTRNFLILGRVWMKVYMNLIFCPVYHKGKKYFEKGKVYVVVCNHNSFVDVLVATPGIPGTNKTLAKHEIGKVPIFGMMYKIGGIMVNRNDDVSRKQSFEHMRNALKMGMHMALFPEGTRNRTPFPLKRFYDGAFVLAIETQTPIMPSVIFHTRKIQVPGKFLFAIPHRIEYHFLPPVETAGLTKEDLPVLKEKVFMLMWDHYMANGGGEDLITPA
ncbi:1-acyl-sn-glycerol-3-phosphate acyltransferase [Chitinophaga sp. SYP-B3965]|uniref:lysophospholipid acyltransferase family protein n=1 Tax=Chitinophaga sp. SYP-B3965 TaxID=2663120 RepID=UPI001299F4B0|nr:1-acyl-sn-glycerol-3-phosphate acyltransferase [Chitinophaga sp. SYP-B3965]MRG45445.1 1-acyl-sn-glycerol-3-phosphate acyltransferase [Chitinophaga sp. SYP-B3965]